MYMCPDQNLYTGPCRRVALHSAKCLEFSEVLLSKLGQSLIFWTDDFICSSLTVADVCMRKNAMFVFM